MLRRLVPVAVALAVAGCGREQARPPAATTGQAALDVVQTVPVSTTEHDRLLGVAFDGTNRLYAYGWVGDGADQMMALTRFRSGGTRSRIEVRHA